MLNQEDCVLIRKDEKKTGKLSLKTTYYNMPRRKPNQNRITSEIYVSTLFLPYFNILRKPFALLFIMNQRYNFIYTNALCSGATPLVM